MLLLEAFQFHFIDHLRGNHCGGRGDRRITRIRRRRLKQFGMRRDQFGGWWYHSIIIILVRISIRPCTDDTTAIAIGNRLLLRRGRMSRITGGRYCCCCCG